MTQQQFAIKLGVATQTVNRWERDRCYPSPLSKKRLKAHGWHESLKAQLPAPPPRLQDGNGHQQEGAV